MSVLNRMGLCTCCKRHIARQLAIHLSLALAVTATIMTLGLFIAGVI